MSESQAALELEAVNQAIIQILKTGVSEWEIHDRKATNLDLPTLKRIQSQLRLRVKREQSKVKGIRKKQITFGC